MEKSENYGVLDMNSVEIKKIEGGKLPSTYESSAKVTSYISHAVIDFFSGAIDRFNLYRTK